MGYDAGWFTQISTYDTVRRDADEERTIAVADAGCKTSSDLMRTVIDVTHEYEPQAVRDNHTTMDAIKRLSATILANAQR